MLFGRTLRNINAVQMLDHINYMQSILEQKAEQLRKREEAVDRELKELADKIAALESAATAEG